METLKYSNVNFCILFLSLLYVQFQKKTNKQKKITLSGSTPGYHGDGTVVNSKNLQ